ncbi:MAG: hypothetical protein OXE78_00570 [Gammaproteobacteria bacterium]|nr:hypothetical protein [Gammaproteobacteria bacterium]MCY4356690.1 hypothetical protein [Gammaproteobacteria bacterium]
MAQLVGDSGSSDKDKFGSGLTKCRPDILNFRIKGIEKPGVHRSYEHRVDIAVRIASSGNILIRISGRELPLARRQITLCGEAD